MPSIFEKQFSRARAARNRALGVEIVLRRGSSISCPVKVRRDERQYQTTGFEGDVINSIVGRDYYIPVSLLKIDGVQIEPLRGDLIVEGSETYEVLPSDDGSNKSSLIHGGFEWLVRTKRRSEQA